jgi:hypothetical protein
MYPRRNSLIETGLQWNHLVVEKEQNTLAIIQLVCILSNQYDVGGHPYPMRLTINPLPIGVPDSLMSHYTVTEEYFYQCVLGSPSLCAVKGSSAIVCAAIGFIMLSKDGCKVKAVILLSVVNG